MIDIHSHIMFGIDDGSKSMDESLSIICKAIDNGYTDIMLTPHYRYMQNFVCNNLCKYRRYVELKKEVEKRTKMLLEQQQKSVLQPDKIEKTGGLL